MQSSNELKARVIGNIDTSLQIYLIDNLIISIIWEAISSGNIDVMDDFNLFFKT